MDFGRIYVPKEILDLIIGHIQHDLAGVKNARLVCKAFNEAASCYLLSSFYISPFPRDCEIAMAIAKGRISGRHIEEVRYDCTVFEEDLARPEVYANVLGTRNNLSNFRWTYRTPDLQSVTYTPDAVRRGHGRYERSFAFQSSLKSPCAPEFSHITRAAIERNPALLISDGFPPDAATLILALQRTPSVWRFVLDRSRYQKAHPRRYFHQARRRNATHCFTLAINSDGPNGEEAVNLNPSPVPGALATAECYPTEWNVDYVRRTCRGLYVLFHAASIMGTDIDMLQIEIPHEAFDMSPIELHHACNTFQWLKIVSLIFITDGHNYANPDGTRPPLFESGHLAQALSSAHGLEQLGVAFNHPYTGVRSSKLLGTRVFPRLWELSFVNVRFEPDDLLGLLGRHAASLESLTINCMWPGLVMGPVCHPIAMTHYDDGPFHSISDMLRRMSGLGLQLMELDLDMTAERTYRYVGEQSMEIHRFLASGGTDLGSWAPNMEWATN